MCLSFYFKITCRLTVNGNIFINCRFHACTYYLNISRIQKHEQDYDILLKGKFFAAVKKSKLGHILIRNTFILMQSMHHKTKAIELRVLQTAFLSFYGSKSSNNVSYFFLFLSYILFGYIFLV